MAIDIEHIKNHYSKMDDFKLERIAKYEIAKLKPEIINIVTDEIKRRGLDVNLLSGIEAQTKIVSKEEVYELTVKVKKLDCPSCGKSNQGLVGGIIRKVRSYIIFTHFERRTMIACKKCVELERKIQLIKNSIFGWWGFPSGLLYSTPSAIINHFLDNRKNEAISELIISDFVLQNIGELKTNWGNEEKLVDFIYHHNNNTDQ